MTMVALSAISPSTASTPAASAASSQPSRRSRASESSTLANSARVSSSASAELAARSNAFMTAARGKTALRSAARDQKAKQQSGPGPQTNRAPGVLMDPVVRGMRGLAAASHDALLQVIETFPGLLQYVLGALAQCARLVPAGRRSVREQRIDVRQEILHINNQFFACGIHATSPIPAIKDHVPL